ncbi:site-specific integrase [Candidatus Manganitrophus noduliformans]|uniref:Site-specific integrase n=1 Tax=Candidatus Manganitrophus noduliformans TaxID=2606439 RepID=A0A7X6DVQ8_9BACT|nr:site-specific integrase [Candidatus Manganitrophus noduliformans]
MSYQYKREPLTQDEANRLANACQTHEEKLVVWTLLHTGLKVNELANLKKENIDRQNHYLMVYGKRRTVWVPNQTPHHLSLLASNRSSRDTSLFMKRLGWVIILSSAWLKESPTAPIYRVR